MLKASMRKAPLRKASPVLPLPTPWKRHFHPFLPPLLFTGLVISLYTWKCCMLVVFQSFIIYNPFIPPDSRTVRIADFAKQCRDFEWREKRIKASDGTQIALCTNELECAGAASKAHDPTYVYIVYFQGNAASTPYRLPDITSILGIVRDLGPKAADVYSTICLSYRGYWTSHDRPSERGINLDSMATLAYVERTHDERKAKNPNCKSVLVLWGQSIGSGFVTNLAASHPDRPKMKIDALVLETPFTNTRDMLKALYPQRWLPYQYLWPFLRTKLDSYKNMSFIAQLPSHRRPEIHIIEAGQDELVPRHHATILANHGRDVGLNVEHHCVQKALHNGVMTGNSGRQAIARAIAKAVHDALHRQNGPEK
ncbi:hypothetical protein CDD82_4666 [Ophiocordyceps australis]|uniref:AB hydrolase-1 domain-containing protein n=1 Tax=Ophiocordyceps australis TaxID=1399860 RepID=A0A2C5ZW63_9HYPO|nr:hypothetical protein CDD82_4666 [Ophiocordyceps australis]